jgi:hypothetical protein
VGASTSQWASTACYRVALPVFGGAASRPASVALDAWMIRGWWIGNDVQGAGRGRSQATSLEFSWRDRGRPLEASVRISCVPAPEYKAVALALKPTSWVLSAIGMNRRTALFKACRHVSFFHNHRRWILRLQIFILYRDGGTCGGLQSMPPNYLTILLLPITTPVLQSLQYTDYRAVCRRPFSFEAHFELFMSSLLGGQRITSYIFPPWRLA